MAQLTHTIKIMLFQSQFEIITEETSGLQHFVCYSILYFVRYWFAAPIATIAPRSHLEYLQQLDGNI